MTEKGATAGRTCRGCGAANAGDAAFCFSCGASLRATTGPAPGQVVDGRFELYNEAGRGAFGVVFKAVDISMGTQVAVKFLEHHVLDTVEERRKARELFAREVAAGEKLRHKNIVPLLASGTHQGQPYIVMEWIQGETLGSLVKKGPLDLENGVRILSDVLAALAHAHSAGVVHRDVKPENVLVRASDGEARLADFGIAKIMETLSGGPDRTRSRGTPSYMAPEQAAGADIDGRTDLFSAGIMAYEVFTGSKPFTGAGAVVMKSLRDDPLPPNPALSPSMKAWLDRAAAKRPSDRFDSASAMRAALLQLAPESSPLRLHVLETAQGNLSPRPRPQRATPTPDLDLAEVAPAQRTAAVGKQAGVIAATVLGILGVATLAAWLAFRPSAQPPAATATTPSATPSTPPAPAAASTPTPVAVSPTPQEAPSMAAAPARSPAPEPTPEPKPLKGLLKIATVPEGAAVLIDGKHAGTTPASIELTLSASHTVIVKKDGYETFTDLDYSQAELARSLDLSLTRFPAPEPSKPTPTAPAPSPTTVAYLPTKASTPAPSPSTGKSSEPDATPPVQDKAREVFDQMIKGLGGAANIDAIRDLHYELSWKGSGLGVLNSAGQEVWIRPPDRIRSSSAGKLMVLSPLVSYKRETKISMREALGSKDIELLRTTLNTTPLLVAQRRNDPSLKLEYRGTEMTAAGLADVIEVTLQSSTVTFHVSASGDLVKVATMGQIEETTEFQTISGVRVPVLENLTVEGGSKYKVKVSVFEINVGIPDDKFE